MAKRAPVGEEPYRPLLDASAISAALARTPVATTTQAPTIQSKVVELTRTLEHPTREATPAPSQNNAMRTPLEERRQPFSLENMVEKLDQEKRMLLTRAESAALERLVSSVASRMNTQVKSSHVLRALVTLLLNAESALDRRAGETVGLMRPANGDFKGLQRFEREIARIIAAALRDSPPLRDS